MAIGSVNGPEGGSPFRSMGIASSGLSSQRARIEVIAENIANVDTRNADGTPFRRLMVELRQREFSETAEGGAIGEGGVEVAGVVEDATPGVLIYDPGHTDADENGMVEMSNVSVIDEMVDLMDAKQHYEANATVFEAVKSMLRRATQL